MVADVAAITPVRRPKAADVVAALVLIGLAVAGVALRLPLLGLGTTSDELANVTDGGFRAILDHPETAVNPPALRWVANLPFDDWGAVRWGRRLALACSVASIGLGYVVGRRAAGGHVLAGLLAAALLAFHPYPVHDAAQLRAYAWWTATALVHVLAMGAALDAEPGPVRRRWLALAIASAALLPWIHYFAVPVLLALGVAVVVAMPGRRGLVLAYVPAALGVLPLVPRVLAPSSQRVAPDREPVGIVLQRLTSLELRTTGPAWDLFGKAWKAAVGGWPDAGTAMAVTTALLLLAAVPLAGRLPRTARLVVAGVVGVLAGALAFAQVQYVRPSTLSMVLTFAAPALPAVVAALPRGRTAALVLLGAWYGADLPARYRLQAFTWSADEATPWLARHHEEVTARAAGRPVWIVPREATWSVWYHLTHTVPRRAPRDERCAGLDPCFSIAGHAWAGVRDPGDGAGLDGVLVSLDPWRREGFASACTPVEVHPAWGVWDCPGTR
jgi:hypothetical protein